MTMTWRKRFSTIRFEILESRFCLAITFSEGGRPFGDAETLDVALGDVDGDGDIDALVAVPQSYQLWLNSGEGVFQQTDQTLPSPRSSQIARFQRVALVDLDGDGDLDALTDSGPLLNDGAGTLTGGIPPNPGFFLTARGDLNGDGAVDIFRVTHTLIPQTTEVWLNDGTARFALSGQTFEAGGGISVALGDLDADGDLDAFVGAARTGQSLLLNDGAGRFTATGQTVGAGFTRMIAIGDLDGDEDLDVYLSNSGNFQVLLNDGTAHFSDAGQNPAFASARSVDLVDLDRDSDLDVLVPLGDGKLIVRPNDGLAHFGAPIRVAMSPDAADVVHARVGDLDGDGDVDIAVVNERRELNVWWNTSTRPVGDVNGDGQFNQQDIVLVLQAARYLTGAPATFEEGDWNGDAVFDQLDIVAALQTGRYLQGAYAVRLIDTIFAAHAR